MLTPALHGSSLHRSLWGKIMGRVRCHLESELSHQNACRATPITWGRIAHVVMIQRMEGEHTRRARTTPSAKNSIGHSSITVRGSDENEDAKPKCNRAVLPVPSPIPVTFNDIPHHNPPSHASNPVHSNSAFLREDIQRPLFKAILVPAFARNISSILEKGTAVPPVWKMSYKHSPPL